MSQFERIPTKELTPQQKRDCVKMIGTIIEFCMLARNEGLLSLEEKSDDASYPFLLRKGISLVVDGYEPNSISEILQGYIRTGNFDGFELVQRQIIASGVLSLMAGEHQRVIREQLLPYLGEAFHDEALSLLNKGGL